MRTMIFVAFLCDGHNVGLISPLSEKAGSGFEGWGSGELCSRIPFQHLGNLAEPFTSARTQSPECLFLDSIGQDTDHERAAKPPGWSGLEELAPEARKVILVHVGQGSEVGGDTIAHIVASYILTTLPLCLGRQSSQ
jgi:hypothetical protein